MHSDYTHGRLITDDHWHFLSKMYEKLYQIEKKEKYLKTEKDSMKKMAIVETFLGADLEEFFILTESSKLMYSMLLDLEDYFLFKNNSEESAFESEEDALKAVESVFEKLEKIKSDVDSYLQEDFE